MEKKKICFIVTVEFAVTAFLLSHFRQLAKQFDLSLIVSTDDHGFLQDQGYEIKIFPVDISRRINLLKDLSALIKIHNILCEQHFDAVHTMTPKAGLLGMLAAFLASVPIRVHTFTGQTWTSKSGLSRMFLKRMDWLIAKLAVQVIIDSPSQANFLIAEMVVSPQKINVFGFGSVAGVDLNRFTPSLEFRRSIRADLSIPESYLVFIYLGRLSRDKGLVDLVNAFLLMDSIDATLLIVGPDEDGLKAVIEQISANSRGSIKFVSLTSIPEAYLAASDVLCLPSYREGFGSVIIEAASVGLPAVASNIYGVTDAILNNETGLLHEPRDVSGIKFCLESFMKDRRLLEQYGQTARLRAIACFDAKIITNAWMNFYIAQFKSQ
jgi:glycosyltransferase involved in cell wall biosynthesis